MKNTFRLAVILGAITFALVMHKKTKANRKPAQVRAPAAHRTVKAAARPQRPAARPAPKYNPIEAADAARRAANARHGQMLRQLSE